MGDGTFGEGYSDAPLLPKDRSSVRRLIEDAQYRSKVWQSLKSALLAVTVIIPTIVAAIEVYRSLRPPG